MSSHFFTLFSTFHFYFEDEVVYLYLDSCLSSPCFCVQDQIIAFTVDWMNEPYVSIHVSLMAWEMIWIQYNRIRGASMIECSNTIRYSSRTLPTWMLQSQALHAAAQASWIHNFLLLLLLLGISVSYVRLLCVYPISLLHFYCTNMVSLPLWPINIHAWRALLSFSFTACITCLIRL